MGRKGECVVCLRERDEGGGEEGRVCCVSERAG